jgi:endonuclease G, mitochondrial
MPKSANWPVRSNAVPQRSHFNKRPWFALECLTGAWANHYGLLWVVSGPVFLEGTPAHWLKSDIYPGALPVTIPDELFKLVARRTDSWQALAFKRMKATPIVHGISRPI